MKPLQATILLSMIFLGSGNMMTVEEERGQHYYYEAIMEVTSGDFSEPEGLQGLPFTFDMIKTNVEEMPDVVIEEYSQDTFDMNVTGECFLLPVQRNESTNGSYFDAHSFCVKESVENTCEACIPGFSRLEGGRGCEPCAAGTYKAGYGNESCSPCTQGFSTFNLRGQTVCRGCAAGSFSNATGLRDCILCEKDHYQTRASATFCTRCPAHSESASRGSVSVSDCVCSKGSHAHFSRNDSNPCKLCRVGHYQELTNASACVACPPLWSTLAEGASSCDACAAGASLDANSRECIECAKGYHSQTGEHCAACPHGKYQDATFASFCYNCPYGSTERQGSTSEKDCVCPVGHAKFVERSQCVSCSVGKYQPRTNATSCIECPLPWSSTHLNGSSFCDKCATGSILTWTADKASDCVPCPVGTYYAENISESTATINTSHFVSARECRICSRGTFSQGIGSTTCLQCPEDTFSNQGGQSMCTICPQFSHTSGKRGALNCTCILGFVERTVNVETSSENIANNKENTTVNSEMEAKNAENTTVNSEMEAKNAENEGTGERPKMCVACEPGKYQAMSGANCSDCPPGTFSDEYGTGPTCKICSVRMSTTRSGSSSCDACVPGTSKDAFFKDCIECGRGYYSETGDQCIACEYGKYQNVTMSSHCHACPYANSVTQRQGSAFLHDCVCPKGHARELNHNDAACRPCAVGTYQDTYNATACSVCPGPWASTFSEASEFCDKCAEGSYLNDSSLCMPCPRGSYFSNIAENSSSCTLCGRGTFSSQEGSTWCTGCGVDTFSLEEGAPICLECPPFSDTRDMNGSLNCTCKLGAVQDQNGSCVACEPGKYQPHAEEGCRNCPAGTFSVEYGRAVACTTCETGTYSKSEKSTHCSTCPDHSWNSAQGLTTCECFSGFSKDAYDLDCIQCAEGFYSNESTQFTCMQCPEGTISNATGPTIACTACEVGTFSRLRGSHQCTSCPDHSWNSAQSLTRCECFSGFTKSQDETSCEPCRRGYYSNASTQFACLPCPPGTFNNEIVGQTHCYECPDATVAQHIASTQCYACQNGSVASKNKSACTCVVGQNFNHTETLGQWTCKNCTQQCPEGQYITKDCTLEQDTVCAPCKKECQQRGQFIMANCTPREDTRCRVCSVSCRLGFFMKVPCTNTNDIVCSKCTAECNATEGLYLYSPCRLDADAVCRKCPMGSYPEPIHQTGCVQCAPGTIVEKNSCVSCDGYTSENQTKCVTGKCASNEYPINQTTCAECPKNTVGVDGLRCEPCLSSDESCASPEFTVRPPADTCSAD